MEDVDVIVVVCGESFEVLVGEDDPVLPVVEGLVDIVVVDGPTAFLAAMLIADPPSVLRMDLVYPDVVVLRGQYSFTGTFTRPKAMDPVQILSCPIETQDPGTGYPCPRSTSSKRLAPGLQSDSRALRAEASRRR